MKILTYCNQDIQTSIVSNGSCRGFKWLTSKQFDKAAKKLEKQIEKRRKTESGSN